MATPRFSDHESGFAPPPQATPEQHKSNMESKTARVGTASVVPSLSEKSHGLPAQRPGWTSTYLKNTTLLSFAIVFLSLLLAIIALAIVDSKNDGIANAKSSEHYLWTYGPTAVLVIVAALWNQVEYRIKHAMPWALLQKGPTPASKTLFMDYITPGKPEALLASLRKSHWPVAISIINSFLITLLTVASTGLLVLQNTPFVHHDCRLNVTDDFVSTFDPVAIGSAPVLATFAIQNKTIPIPPGTTRDAAFQSLAAPTSFSGFTNIEVEGLTSSFHAGLNCEIAAVQSGASGCSDRQCRSLNVTIDIISPTCEIKGYNLTQSCGKQLDTVFCDLNDLEGISCDAYAEGHGQNRLVFMYGQLKQDLGGASKNVTKALEIVTDNTTTIICEPNYQITDTYVVMDQNGNLKDIARQVTNTSRAQQFPPWNLVEGLRTAANVGGLWTPYSYQVTDLFPWTNLHKMFVSWVGSVDASSDLKDPSVLQSRANEMFAIASAQMAKQNLMRASTGITIGICRGTEDRLRVRGLSLYLMAALLVLLIVSTISLLYIVPRRYSSRDPGSIGGLALVVSQSPALLSSLSTLGSADLKTMSQQLDNVECQILLNLDGEHRQLTIDLNTNENSTEPYTSPDTARVADPSYWQPLSLRPIFKLSVITALLILVVVLEVLYSVSRKHNGLAEVNSQSYQRFAWAYVPAMVMLTAQTLVGMITFSSLMIFPYFQLRKSPSNTRNDILTNYASETAIKCLWQSVVAKHVVVACIALAMLLAPLLTIAVSGLYTAQATSVRDAVTLSVRHQLNSSFSPKDIPSGSSQRSTASTNIGLLLTQNFTYPTWTFDELAFPEATLDVAAITNSSTLSGGNITATLPAIRSDLVCTIASSVPTNFSDTVGKFHYRKANVSAFEALGAYGLQDGFLWPSPGLQPFGFFTACGERDYDDIVNTFCGAFGTSETNWNAFTCTSLINMMNVEVTMAATSLSILSAKPQESTTRLFSNETIAPAGLQAYPSSMIPGLFGNANFEGSFAVAGYYDTVFQAVVYGLGTRHSLDDFPMADYMNNNGVEKIFNQLQHIHRTVIAQSANMIRIPLNTTSALAPPPTINATFVDPHVFRLQQSAVSTRILDGLLVAIVLCVALSFVLMDARKVLPKNPASIAAAASLIAGESQMLSKEALPEGVQWYDDAELESKRVWDGLFFRLGWWDNNGLSEQESKLFKLDAL